MANGLRYPGVTVVQRTIGGTIYLKFNDPRQFDKKGRARQKMLSTFSADRRIAERYAQSLSTILSGKLFDTPPAGTPPRVRQMLGLKTPGQRADEHAAPVFDAWRRLMAGLLALKIHASLEGREHHDEYAREALGELSQAAEAAKEDYQRALLDLDRLRRALAEARGEAERWKTKANAFEAQIVQSGMAAVANLGGKTLEMAALEYLKEGTKAGKSKIASIRAWVNSFVAYCGADTLLRELNQNTVLAYCRMLGQRMEEEGLSVDWIRGHVKYARYFLEYATGGAFPLKRVKDWQKKNLRERGREWYWLEKGQPAELIKQIRKRKGDYWADAAAIQHGCGFRPSELPLLMSRNVKVKRGRMTLFIEPIYEKGKLVRRLKTPDSKGTVEVPSFAQAAVTRRLEGKTFLLFPRSPEARWNRPTWRGYTPFEKEKMLWPENTWCAAYSDALRSGVDAIKRIDRARFDGRTLRRTCGKELLLAGKTLEETAAVLRDHPMSVRRYYARLLPSDVSTER